MIDNESAINGSFKYYSSASTKSHKKQASILEINLFLLNDNVVKLFTVTHLLFTITIYAS